MKKDIYANTPFANGDEYHAFVRQYKVFGKEAHDLKRKLDKKKNIGIPRRRKRKY